MFNEATFREILFPLSISQNIASLNTFVQKVTKLIITLVSGIKVPGRLLIFKKISTRHMLIPVTPFTYFWNFFHSPHLFRTLFFLFRNIKSWRNNELLFNYSYKNILFRVLVNLLFFDYPNRQVRNFTSFFKTCTCTRCSFVSIVNGFSHLISFKK